MTTAATTGAPVWLRRIVLSVRTFTTVGALSTVAGFAALNMIAAPGATAPSATTSTTTTTSGPIDALMQEHECSFTGFGKDVVPGSALVRTPAGDVRVVSFDEGWDVFSGEAAGELVAVCRAPVPLTPAADAG